MNQYLIDSNILIHILAGDLPERAYSIVREICNQSFLVSIISKIEIPGWKNGTPDGLAMARNLLLEADIISLSDPISDIAITIRQKQAIKLPDAVIAGTAIFLDATLVT
ncbi:MAG: PIN domain protein [Euryarchaeota archaeon ADurb.Bin294]|jgi:hypothetical protein|nr:MAG: PIN domain protein [Euryarchaeota archaeon ADurb.Bin294]